MTVTQDELKGRLRHAGFSHLLAICDGNVGEDTTLEIATEIVRETSASLTLMSVLERPPGLVRLAKHTSVDADEIIRRMVDDERQRLADLTLALSIPCKIEVRVGKEFLEIIREVISNSCDLVIKAADAPAGMPRGFFTSTDQHLLRKCPAPVWLHMPSTAQPPQIVVAAVDVDLVSAAQPDTMRDLNHHVVITAAEIARQSDAVLHIVHAWDGAGEGLIWMWSNAANAKKEVDAYLKSVFEESQKNLKALVKDASIPETHLRLHSIRGPAREVIPEKVKALKADTLVMGSVARTGIPGFIIGNTAEDVLNRVETSVVIVKPPGYVSPVKV
ncbi:MAG: universal stress protein [Pseudomonadota bacterium]